MACPDASAAIHECVLAIKARVPVDVLAETIHAFPSTSRIFNGLFADAAQGAGRGASRSGRSAAPSGLEDDPAVHEDDRRGGRSTSAPPGSTGSSRQAAGMTTRSARWPTVSRPRSVSRVEIAGSTQAARIARSSGQRLVRAERPASPPASARSSRRTASAIPGHGSNGSTGASVPNARTAPVAAIEPHV